MATLIGDLVSTAARRRSAAIAATLGATSVTYGQLDAWGDRAAGALAQLGVGAGDIVAWWSGPALHNLAGLLGCARLGAVFAPLAPSLGDAEARAVLEHTAPRRLVCDAERAERGRELAGADAVAVGPGGAGAVASLDAVAAGVRRWTVPNGLADTAAHILYLTSGSTGQPKGVLVSHRASRLRSSELAPGSVEGILCTFPLYHYGGWHYVFEAWVQGTAVHLVARADGPHVVGAVERHRPQAIYCIPAVWDRVLAEPGDLSSLRFADTGTSAVAGGLLQRIAERLPGARTRVLYGASEAGRMAALEHAELAAHPGSVGRAVGRGELRIAPDGEILFRGPTLMNGYLRRPRATAEALRDGWYHTGDLGHQDGEGFLTITGRKRELIRTGGEWVSPVEVEAALGRVPGLRDLAIVGVPDARWGEVVCAAVVTADGAAPPTPAALGARLAGLAPHKRPRAVAAVEGIPRTSATGQVMRAALRAAVLARLAEAAR